jgi:hypothetical protein
VKRSANVGLVARGAQHANQTARGRFDVARYTALPPHIAAARPNVSFFAGVRCAGLLPAHGADRQEKEGQRVCDRREFIVPKDVQHCSNSSGGPRG